MKLATRFVLLAALLSPTALLAQQAERFTLTGREVAIFDLLGNVRVERGTGSSVVVEVIRRGPDGSQLRIEQGPLDGVQTLRVIFPADEIVSPDLSRGSNSNLTINEDGTWNRGRARGGRRVQIFSRDRARNRDYFEAAADLVVHVPANVTLNAHVGVGEIVASGTRADLHLTTMSGDIDVQRGVGRLEASSASGNVSVIDGEGDADINTASGNVDLTGLRASQIDVNVASGNVTVDGVTASSVAVESASGGLRVLRTRAESLNADAASGNVNVRESEIQDLRASTASGTVNVALEGTLQRANISSASGSVTLVVGRALDATIEAESSSGNIDIDFPLQVVRQRRNYIRGQVGSGSAQITLNAASGNVRITRMR